MNEERLATGMKIVKIVYNKNFNGFPSEKEDLLQEGYMAILNADRTFDETKGQFDTYANRAVLNSMNKYLKRKYYKHANNTISIDNTITLSNDKVFEISDLFYKDDINYDNIIYEQTLEEINDKLKKTNENLKVKIDIDRVNKIIELKLKGYNQTEIAKKLGVSQHCVWKRLDHLKKIL